jgi:hypothetical protein
MRLLGGGRKKRQIHLAGVAAAARHEIITKRNRARPCTTVQECDKPFTRIHGKSMTLLEITGIEVFSGAYVPEPQFSLPLFSEPQFE